MTLWVTKFNLFEAGDCLISTQQATFLSYCKFTDGNLDKHNGMLKLRDCCVVEPGLILYRVDSHSVYLKLSF